MGNFEFARVALPALYEDSARAESYLSSDPRSALIYARRVAEHLVNYLYDVLALRPPYQDDLAARLGDAAFKQKVGLGIASKLTIIRKVGNRAVHDDRPIATHAALEVMRELHHVVIWAAFHHSAHPDAVPTSARFDPDLAAQAAPLTRAEVQQLAARFHAQDAAHVAALAERDDLVATRDAEIAELKAQIAAAQASISLPDHHDYSEAETRDLFIDVLLHEAGWPLDQDRDREYEVRGMPNAGGSGFVDYVLWGADGLPLAVVEAKHTRKSAAIGQQQAKLYADALEAQFGRRPVMFFTNGYEHWLWDDAAGYPPREVQGFYAVDELELMIQRRQTRRPLGTAPVSGAIVERPYQLRAIKAIGDALDRKQREALLVMATGSGKTRTVIALVEQLQRANWVKRVLFLADRTALVVQATNAFKAFLPGSTTVNLVTEKAVDGRVYVSTYPTMMNQIDDLDGDLRRFGPGYFDLIVIDEAHRSVYAKYGAIFQYFDAMLVGLTATPKDDVDHNTYRLFHLEDGVPTDAYSLEEAVKANFLVPPRGISVGTKFLRTGIKYDELSEDEKDQWDLLDWGDSGPPDEVGADELNRFLFNEDTVDKVLETLMTRGYRVAGGDRIGKTIVFAKNQQHAEFIAQRFDFAYPELAGHHARVITHATPYAQNLIDDFSQNDKAPHIAISVDMLDTGIDVPEIVNLVFFKPVRSKSKFWQMIGRGTRLRPDLFGPGQDKRDFLVFDFCGNLEYFNQDLPSAEGQTQASLSQRIFEARVGLVSMLGRDGSHPDLRAATTAILHAAVEGMNLHNFVVRHHRRAVERFAEATAWSTLAPEDARVASSLASLPTAIRDDDEYAKRFDLIILRRQLAQLDGDTLFAERLRQTVQDLAGDLLTKMAIPSVAQQAILLESVAGDEWWVDVTLPMLELLRLRVRGLVRFLDRTRRDPVYVDLEDVLGEATEIALPNLTPGTDFERFRMKAQAYLREHEDHVVLQRLRRGRPLTSGDIDELGKLLIAAGGGSAELERAGEEAGSLGTFIRSLVGLERAAVQDEFARYLDGNRFSITQVRFVTLVVDELTINGRMEPRRLFESPYVDHAPTGPDSLFDDADVDTIVSIVRRINESAVAQEVA